MNNQQNIHSNAYEAQNDSFQSEFREKKSELRRNVLLKESRNIQIWVQEHSLCVRLWYLVVPAVALAAVGRLVRHLHVLEVQPGEGLDRLGVVVQVGEVALCGRDGHIEDQPLLRGLLVLRVQGSGGERREDELVDLQHEGGHEGGLRGLVRHGTVDQNRQPHCLRLGKIKNEELLHSFFSVSPPRVNTLTTRSM